MRRRRILGLIPKSHSCVRLGTGLMQQHSHKYSLGLLKSARSSNLHKKVDNLLFPVAIYFTCHFKSFSLWSIRFYGCITTIAIMHVTQYYQSMHIIIIPSIIISLTTDEYNGGGATILLQCCRKDMAMNINGNRKQFFYHAFRLCTGSLRKLKVDKQWWIIVCCMTT